MCKCGKSRPLRSVNWLDSSHQTYLLEGSICDIVDGVWMPIYLGGLYSAAFFLSDGGSPPDSIELPCSPWHSILFLASLQGHRLHKPPPIVIFSQILRKVRAFSSILTQGCGTSCRESRYSEVVECVLSYPFTSELRPQTLGSLEGITSLKMGLLLKKCTWLFSSIFWADPGSDEVFRGTCVDSRSRFPIVQTALETSLLYNATPSVSITIPNSQTF